MAPPSPRLAVLLLAALPLPWLIDHHALPWPSAFPEGVAAGLLLGAALVLRGPVGGLPVAHALFVAGVLATLLLQRVAGQLAFSGEAWMVGLYLAVFTVALTTGAAIGRQPADLRDRLSIAFAAGLLAAAAASVLLAVLQWTWVSAWHQLAAELRLDGRLSANLGQPNHFCTAAFLGLCALGWLHRRGHLGWGVFALLGPWLAFGMAMSQSRTGWLQVGLLAAWLLLLHQRADRPAGTVGLAGWAGVFATYALTWLARPAINEVLLLDTGISMAERLAEGRRLLHLQAFADAVVRAPWTGYGWLQTVSAALESLPARPPREYVESSHNFALDLAVWLGLPAAGLLLGAAFGWIAWRIAGCRDADTAWLLALIGGVWVHGLTEYALAYLYFLVPVGLAMGLVDARAGQGSATSAVLGRIADRVRRPLAVGAAVLLAVVAVDYLRAESHVLQARLENARIGTPGIVTPAPDLRLLDQLETLTAAFTFGPDVADPAAAVAVLDRLTQRYGHAPLLFKQAQLAVLQGRPDDAAGWLARLCAWHFPDVCHGWIARWRDWAADRPAAAAVALPPLPPFPGVRPAAQAPQAQPPTPTGG